MSLNATNSLELSVDSYATMAQITALIPYQTFDADDYPDKPQAVQLARDVFQEINSLVTSLGYVVPVASSNSTALRVLGRLNAFGTASVIEMSSNHRNPGMLEHAEALQARYREIWVTLQKGQVKLIGATMESNYLLRPMDKEAKYVFHTVNGTETSPDFTKTMNF